MQNSGKIGPMENRFRGLRSFFYLMKNHKIVSTILYNLENDSIP